VLALAACGGGDDDASKREFVSKADGICRSYTEKARRIEQPEKVADIEKFAADGKALAEDARDSLRELDPPASVKADFDRFLAEGQRGIVELGNLERAARGRDTGEISAVVGRISDVGREQNETARKIGFKACGRATQS
jgi:hypothetical protein